MKRFAMLPSTITDAKATASTPDFVKANARNARTDHSAT